MSIVCTVMVSCTLYTVFMCTVAKQNNSLFDVHNTWDASHLRLKWVIIITKNVIKYTYISATTFFNKKSLCLLNYIVVFSVVQKVF